MYYKKLIWTFCAATAAITMSGGLSAAALNLPAGPVSVTITEGTSSFFDAALSGVPAGYDVGNNSYSAWCVDLYNTNSPLLDGGGHTAILKSSLGGSLPAPYSGLPWDKLNYIVNHKQGTISDVQAALWYFTDNASPDAVATPAASVMIAEANSQGAGFVPGASDVTLALMVWQGVDAKVQENVIEVPPTGGGPGTTNGCSDRFTSGGFVLVNGKKCSFGIQGGYQNGRLWGGINYIDHGTGMHVKSRSCTSYTILDLNCREATYDVTIDGAAGTATVRVCDNGEPGRNDLLQLTLSTGYNTTALKLSGGNVQLHKGNCAGSVPDTDSSKGAGKGKGKANGKSKAKKS